MKMVKKILLGTLAVATILAFASCGLKQDEEKAFNGDKIEFTHDGTSGTYYRSFKATSTKHYSVNAKVTIENAANYTATTGVSAKAGLGFVFGLEEVTPPTPVKKMVNGTEKTVKFYNFGVASVRYNAAASKSQWYVMWCKNVPDTVFNYNDNTAFSDSSLTGAPTHVPSYIKPTSDAWQDISNLTLVDGNLVALIRSVANTDGSYKIELYDSKDVKIDECTIPASTTGLTARTQKLIGRYLTVYKSQSVKGKIEYSDFSGNVIPADYGIELE